jgi:hypothetical protein
MDPVESLITPEFIESMVDRIVIEITNKLEQLDVSIDYIAAALLDDDALSIKSQQTNIGRTGLRSKANFTDSQ